MTSSIENILSQIENADNKSKNALENKLVAIGNDAVPELGEASVDCLKKAAAMNKDLKWIADYLITEIHLAA